MKISEARTKWVFFPLLIVFFNSFSTYYDPFKLLLSILNPKHPSTFGKLVGNNNTKQKKTIVIRNHNHTAQKIKFSIKDLFSKCDQIRRYLSSQIYNRRELVRNYFQMLLSVVNENTCPSIFI